MLQRAAKYLRPHPRPSPSPGPRHHAHQINYTVILTVLVVIILIMIMMLWTNKLFKYFKQFMYSAFPQPQSLMPWRISLFPDQMVSAG
jgi:F0F1-type ATP synthase membrane subunit a